MWQDVRHDPGHALPGHRFPGEPVTEPQRLVTTRLQLKPDKPFGPPVGEFVRNLRGVADIRAQRLQDVPVARGNCVREALEEPGKPARGRSQVGVQRYVAAEILFERPLERRLPVGPGESQPEPGSRLRYGEEAEVKRLALACIGTRWVADLYAGDAARYRQLAGGEDLGGQLLAPLIDVRQQPIGVATAGQDLSGGADGGRHASYHRGTQLGDSGPYVDLDTHVRSRHVPSGGELGTLEHLDDVRLCEAHD